MKIDLGPTQLQRRRMREQQQREIREVFEGVFVIALAIACLWAAVSLMFWMVEALVR